MFKKIALVLVVLFLSSNFTQAQEKPEFHITTITVSPEDNDNFKDQLRKLIDVFETEKLGPMSLIATYRMGNKWSFVSLRSNRSLFGQVESALLNALKDSSSINTYKKVSESIKQIDFKIDRKVIQQVEEWSYAPQGTPEHDRYAIIQEWNLKPEKEKFDTLMRGIVTWAKQTEYPYVFDTYYTVEQPWKITFVTWVDSLDVYFQKHTIGALNNSNQEMRNLQNLLNTMLIDFHTEINLMMPDYSYFPKQ